MGMDGAESILTWDECAFFQGHPDDRETFV